jgi:hypothetical protein
MDALLFILCAGLALAGFFRTTTGRDLLKVAAAGLSRPAPIQRRPLKSGGADRQRFGGRADFGLRAR